MVVISDSEGVFGGSQVSKEVLRLRQTFSFNNELHLAQCLTTCCKKCRVSSFDALLGLQQAGKNEATTRSGRTEPANEIPHENVEIRERKELSRRCPRLAFHEIIFKCKTIFRHLIARFSTKHLTAAIARQFPFCPHRREKTGAKCHILLLPSGALCYIYRCKVMARNYIFHTSRKRTWKLPSTSLPCERGAYMPPKAPRTSPCTLRWWLWRIVIILTGF